MTSAADEAASRDRIDRMQEAAESRLMEDVPLGFVRDEAGGDPILWDNTPIGARDAAEHSGD